MSYANTVLVGVPGFGIGLDSAARKVVTCDNVTAEESINRAH